MIRLSNIAICVNTFPAFRTNPEGGSVELEEPLYPNDSAMATNSIVRSIQRTKQERLQNSTGNLGVVNHHHATFENGKLHMQHYEINQIDHKH